MSVSNPTPSTVSTIETERTPVPALSRTNLILLAILLVQVAVTAYLFWPSPTATTSGEPLLAGITTDAVTELTITDNNGRAVSFVKEGDTWTLANSEGYPARTEKITQTLDKLVAISADRLVTQTPGSHDRLQVSEDNFLRKVELTTADGTETLYFGSTAGASATHVREASADATYLTGGIATWELDTLNTTWIDVAYFRAETEAISEVTLENANGTFTFVRQEPGEGETIGEWTLADATPDEPVAPANISTLVDRIANLNLHTVLGKTEQPEYGLDAPLATLTVTTSEVTTDTAPAETKTTTFVVGAKDAETNTYYFKSSDSDFYVRLAAFTGDEFVEKQRTDFMVQSTGDAADAPDATAPEVDGSGVITDTGELDAQTPATATIEAGEEVTATDGIEDDEIENEAEEEAAPDAALDASDVVTNTADEDAEAAPEDIEGDTSVDSSEVVTDTEAEAPSTE